MKYVKSLDLAAVATAALTTFVGTGTASATVLYKEAKQTTGAQRPAGLPVRDHRRSNPDVR